MISNSRIEEFIRENDSRYGSKLDKYYDVIKKLIEKKISKNKIYEFIKSEDENIGNKANFYKYCKRFNVKAKTRALEPIKKGSKANTPISKKELNKPNMIINKSAVDILSQDFNLLE